MTVDNARKTFWLHYMATYYKKTNNENIQQKC